ncbi:MAG: hypothetical protein HC910_13865 [Spirulinaceae cyanobacterium SM2_1_0]|nr:hypothetical protein [Spirulinaceae cyanobacterium SM2_1_0]
MVTRLGVTLKGQLGAVLDQMTEAEMPLLGGVINDIEMPQPELSPLAAAPLTGLPGQPTSALHTTDQPPQLTGRNGNGRNGHQKRSTGREVTARR